MSQAFHASCRDRDRALLARLEQQCREAAPDFDPDRPPNSATLVGLFLPDLQRLLVMARMGLISGGTNWGQGHP